MRFNKNNKLLYYEHYINVTNQNVNKIVNCILNCMEDSGYMTKEKINKYIVYFVDGSYKTVYAENMRQAVNYCNKRGYIFVHIEKA